jgi:hypothetical protein
MASVEDLSFKFKHYMLLELVKRKALQRHSKSARRIVELSLEILKSLESIDPQNPQETLKKYLDTVIKACEEFEEFCTLIPPAREILHTTINLW